MLVADHLWVNARPLVLAVLQFAKMLREGLASPVSGARGGDALYAVPYRGAPRCPPLMVSTILL